jgi:hypothetical protein
MKKIFIKHLSILSCCFLIVAISAAQNVGINDPAPTAKLTVKGTEATADGQGAAIKLQNTAGNTNAWYLRAGGTGNNTPNGGFSIADNFGYHFNMGQGGNIGLGIAPSTAKLHVNGGMKIQGLNTLEFGAGVALKELNAGKIGYQTFTPGALDIVGAGTTVATRKVNIFAEGGTTFNGPINVGGSTGTVGQVLTSNAAGVPTWENAALSNNVRFKATFGADDNSGLEPPITYGTEYNFNSTAVSISASGITINRSGLYHIEGYYETITDFHIAPPSTLVIASSLNINGEIFPITLYEGTNRDLGFATLPVTYRYRKSMSFVREEYISAPANVNIFVSSSVILGSSTKGFSARYGRISGYLISD